jgi:hypothetical protein
MLDFSVTFGLVNNLKTHAMLYLGIALIIFLVAVGIAFVTESKNQRTANN